MTPEEAIDVLQEKISPCVAGKWKEAVDVAISALQAQDAPDTNVGGMISRQAAIDALRVAYWDDNIQSAKDDPCIVDAMTDWAIRQVKALPSAQPNDWMERNKERILQAGTEGREIEFRIGGRLFAIREKAQ